jgi:hypothetical protein
VLLPSPANIVVAIRYNLFHDREEVVNELVGRVRVLRVIPSVIKLPGIIHAGVKRVQRRKDGVDDIKRPVWERVAASRLLGIDHRLWLAFGRRVTLWRVDEVDVLVYLIVGTG